MNVISSTLMKHQDLNIQTRTLYEKASSTNFKFFEHTWQNNHIIVWNNSRIFGK